MGSKKCGMLVYTFIKAKLQEQWEIGEKLECQPPKQKGLVTGIMKALLKLDRAFVRLNIEYCAV